MRQAFKGVSLLKGQPIRHPWRNGVATTPPLKHIKELLSVLHEGEIFSSFNSTEIKASLTKSLERVIFSFFKL